MIILHILCNMKIVAGNIEIKKTMKKHCKGYYDLLKREIVPCQSFTDLTGSEYYQCKACQAKSGFDLCLGCNGNICQTYSNTAREFCHEEHHVYLAYFANDKLKVGTAASYRRYERLLEQGAIYSIFLAQTPNGRIARQLESRISNLGISSRVNSSYKMNNFIIDREQEEIDKMLIKEYEYILQRIDEKCRKYLIKPEYNNFTNISDKVKQNLLEESRQLNLFGDMEKPEQKEYEKVSKPEYISGEIMATVGSLILLMNDNRYSVINMKSLEGWIVDFKRRKRGEKNNDSIDKGER